MISLKILLPNIPFNKLRELEHITQRLIDSDLVEIIVLYGAYARSDFRPELYELQPKKCDFNFLVVTAGSEQKQALETAFNNATAFRDIPTEVQLVIETIDMVNRHLENEQFFFTDILHEGKILFDTERFKFAEAKTFTLTCRRELAQQEYTRWSERAYRFFETSEFHTAKGWYQLAAFDLQQAAELAYKTVELVFSQQMTEENYLNALRRRAVHFDLRMIEPFSQPYAVQQRLFEHLDFGYVGGRYMTEEEYPVTPGHLTYWKTEVQKLLEIMEVVCREKIERLRRSENNVL